MLASKERASEFICGRSTGVAEVKSQIFAGIMADLALKYFLELIAQTCCLSV
jgi:hypothetical protein